MGNATFLQSYGQEYERGQKAIAKVEQLEAEIEQLKVARDRWKDMSQESVDEIVYLKNKAYSEAAEAGGN